MASFDKQNLFFVILGLFVLSLCSYIIGYQIGFKSWGKQVSVSLDSSLSVRGLASKESAEENTASVSRDEYADPQNFFTKAKVLEGGSSGNVISAEAGVQSQEENILFVAGNLLYTDEKGNTSFVCSNFSQVQFLFEALGIAIKGEKLVMKITTDCTVNEDPQYIGPFAIPAKKILESPAVESKFKTENSEIEFENVSLSWPKSWVLIRADFKKAGVSDFSITTKPPETEDDLFLVEF